jgi:trehalose 6-phosphate phosphatase
MQTSTSAQHWQTTTSTLLYPLIKAERLGLLVDMDGTLSHIAETPEAAFVTPRNRELLGTLVLMLPLVSVVSGRAARDLNQRVAVPGVIYVGNHGLERWVDGSRVLDDRVRGFRSSIAAALDEIRPHLTVGMWIEDKYATASIHYRMTPQPDKASEILQPLLAEIAERHYLVTHNGNRLIEIRPPIEANKGTALNELTDEYDLDAVLYIGDDITDIDALNAARELRKTRSCYGIGIGVMNNDNVHSDAVVQASDAVATSVSDVEDLLAWLVTMLSKERVS